MIVNLTSTRVEFISLGRSVVFRGDDLLSGYIRTNGPAPPDEGVMVRLMLSREASEVQGLDYYDIDFRHITNQPTWTRNVQTEGAQNCLDDLTPLFRKCCASSSGGGQVDEVAAGDGITVDNTDPTIPIVSAKVDGVTIDFNGSGELEVVGGGSGITALTGDGTATGPGSAALTLATVNADVGTFGSATQAIIATFNAKGLVTSVSQTTITPAASSLTGLGVGVATALAINVGSSGAIVVLNGAGGTPSSLTLTNATGLPIGGITGLGTGVATALAIAVGSAGAFVTFNGAGGTPSSINLTNGTSLPISTGVSGLGTGVATALAQAVNTASGFVTQTGGDARYVPITKVINTQSGATYTLAQADYSTATALNRFTNAGAVAFTVPLNATVPISVGSKFDCAYLGAAQLTIAGSGGVTLNSFGGWLNTGGTNAPFTLIKVATDTWFVTGILVP